jgi:RNA polymerase sigma-70 factor (ECF subfamily)
MTAALPLPFVLVGEPPADAEQRLVERVRAGDPAALGEAYDLHHEHVRAFARRVVGDDSAAEDLVQEAFLTLPRALKGFRGGAALRTFLMSIAVNHARHHVRAAVRRRAAMTRLAREPVTAPAGPAEAMARAELARALLRALDALPIDQRVAFVLCEVEDRTSADAARIAGVPESTIRTRLFHARRKLGELLSEEGVR